MSAPVETVEATPAPAPSTPVEKKEPKKTNCLICGEAHAVKECPKMAIKTDDFCSKCGQKGHSVNLFIYLFTIIYNYNYNIV